MRHIPKFLGQCLIIEQLFNYNKGRAQDYNFLNCPFNETLQWGLILLNMSLYGTVLTGRSVSTLTDVKTK